MEETITNEMLFVHPKFFGDNDEHEYNVTCSNGSAVAVPTAGELEAHPNAPKLIKLAYPKLEELNDTQKRMCLDYRGIYDEPTEKCNYADVCMSMGLILKQ